MPSNIFQYIHSVKILDIGGVDIKSVLILHGQN